MVVFIADIITTNAKYSNMLTVVVWLPPPVNFINFSHQVFAILLSLPIMLYNSYCHFIYVIPPCCFTCLKPIMNCIYYMLLLNTNVAVIIRLAACTTNVMLCSFFSYHLLMIYYVACPITGVIFDLSVV